MQRLYNSSERPNRCVYCSNLQSAIKNWSCGKEQDQLKTEKLRLRLTECLLINF
ncbi:MAG: hypothetical protein RIC07_32525 [Coleofasciculus sp. E1-EBD-02]|jgi:hypothetical protein